MHVKRISPCTCMRIPPVNLLIICPPVLIPSLRRPPEIGLQCGTMRVMMVLTATDDSKKGFLRGLLVLLLLFNQMTCLTAAPF
jgi:hypothetical protein